MALIIAVITEFELFIKKKKKTFSRVVVMKKAFGQHILVKPFVQQVIHF